MIKILDPKQNYLKFIEPVILNSFQDLILWKNEMLNQVQHHTYVKIQKNHFDDLDLEIRIWDLKFCYDGIRSYG